MTGFLGLPDVSAEVQHLFDEDIDSHGYVMNASRLWAYAPGMHDQLFALMRQAAAVPGLDVRQRGILVLACASTLGDSYCSLAWGAKLASVADVPTAAGVLLGGDAGLTAREHAMADWARKVAGDPNGTRAGDVQELRDAGYADAEIFAITVYVALRLAFSTVNDALGARPDSELGVDAPGAVRDAVGYGRPIDDSPVRPGHSGSGTSAPAGIPAAT